MLLCKQYTFGEKIYYNSRDIEFCLGVYIFGAPCRVMYWTYLLVACNWTRYIYTTSR